MQTQPSTSQTPSRTQITFVAFLVFIVLILTYLASAFTELVWVVTAIALILGIGQWLLPNFQVGGVSMEGIRNFLRQWGL